MTVLEMNMRHGFICACPRQFERRTERRNREHATADGFYITAVALGSGMENLHILERGGLIETRNWFSGLVFSRIAARGQHNRDGGARIPFNRALIDFSVNRRLQQWQQV